jgi:ABC-type antimicrobial peptide transport system permease subunit
MFSWLASAVGAIALILTLIGTYGVLSYLVAQRSREIGIRMALGARMTDVQRVFMRQALRLTTAGILIGIGMAPTVTRVMATFLFGVGPTDPVTYAAVSGVLAVATLVGTYLPARRATRVDPLVALRAE